MYNQQIITKFGDVKLKRIDTVQTMSHSSKSVKTSGNQDVVKVDTTQLFQRIVCTIHSPKDLRDCFCHELSTVPLSLFEENGGMRKTKKSALYDIFNNVPEPTLDSDRFYVLDGGSLIHRVIWPKEGTYSDIYSAYVKYIKKCYGVNVVVVFDGYGENCTSTKSSERLRRMLNRKCPRIEFHEQMPITETKASLLSNILNKERFITQLSNRLNSEGISSLTANDDADMLIVNTAIEEAERNENVVVVGQDIDLLVLLLGLTPPDKNIFLLKEGQGTIKKRLYSTRSLIEGDVIENCRDSILFLHAVSGCDTTSAFYGKGKAQSILLGNKVDLRDTINVFNNPDASREQVEEAGERYILALYGAKQTEKSIELRYVHFNKYVGLKNNAVLLSKLPPSSGAACQHSMRTFHQVQLWRGNALNPENWGWKKNCNFLAPIYTTKSPAPQSILKIVSCSCKKGCGKRCGCVKAGLRCSTMCRHCQGLSCFNKPLEEHNDDADSF